MKNIEDVFNSDYMRKRLFIAWRAPIVCAAIAKIFNPSSVVDVGCSVGDLVQGFNAIGIDAIGIDGSRATLEHLQCSQKDILIRDLRVQQKISGVKADLAICFEVYTIFEDEYKNKLLKNLTGISKKILLGAAEQRREEVLGRMAALKYSHFPVAEKRLRAELEQWKSKPAIKAIYHNTMYFEKRQ